MPFSFPSSPTVGQVSTQNGRSYTYAGNQVWELTPAAGGSGLSWSSVPASATATGTAGQIAYDNASGFFYVATATNTWKRAALSSWVTPDSIAGLAAWYDASDALTLYDATSGGSLSATDGTVARWQDKSGNARHFTSSAGPTNKAAIQNGMRGLLFDGSSHFMSVPGSASTMTFLHDGDSTIFIVMKSLLNSSANRAIIDTVCDGGLSNGNRTGFFLALRYDFGSSTPYDKAQTLIASGGLSQANIYTGDNSYPRSTTALMSVVSDPGASNSGDRAKFYSNGTFQSSTVAEAGSSVPSGASAHDVTLCATSGSNGRIFLNAYVHEVVMYSTALNGTQRAQIEAYLMAKWGIS